MPSPRNSIGQEETGDTDNRSISTKRIAEDAVVVEASAAPEGYLPLSGFVNDIGTNNQFAKISTGPEDECDIDDDDRDGINAPSESFYFNPNAFRNLNGTDTSPIVSDMENSNFDELAMSALSKLDEEYKRTMTEKKNISENEKQEDGDIKIIAAGFDERNNKLQQICERGSSSTHGEEFYEKPSLDVVEKGKRTQHENHEDTIDTDAIRRAVETISMKNKDDRFQRKFAVWQQNRILQQLQQQNIHHKLIPKSTYKMFHETIPTPKSRLASANLTRSATLAEAVVRLSLLSFQGNSLLFDIVGVDHVECDSSSTVRNTFRPFLKWLEDHILITKRDRKIHVHFRLIGRELSIKTTMNGIIDDLLAPSSMPIPSLRATATYHSGVYHEFLEGIQKAGNKSYDGDDCNYLEYKGTPDLVVAFNAGIWGYQEWADTVKYLAQQKYPTKTIPKTEAKDNNYVQCGIPFVVTAYTLAECQEDEELVSQSINSDHYHGKILWKPKLNPFASQAIRETKGSTEVYRENAYWQAWLFGGKMPRLS